MVDGGFYGPAYSGPLRELELRWGSAGGGDRLADRAPDHQTGNAVEDQVDADQGADDPDGGARAVVPDQAAEQDADYAVEEDPADAVHSAMAPIGDDADHALNDEDDAEHEGEGEESAQRKEGDIDAADDE